LLDEIRVLTNIVDSEGACLRVVLAGTPKLEEILTHPQLESLNQRIVSRAYLQPLGQSEVKAYLEAKVALAGGRFEAIFETGSAELISRASEGVPRLIDQLADQRIEACSIPFTSHDKGWRCDQLIGMAIRRRAIKHSLTKLRIYASIK
jgi:general secretion pathway protein A